MDAIMVDKKQLKEEEHGGERSQLNKEEQEEDRPGMGK